MLQAVLFDVDGVLVDSYAAHHESWRTLAHEHGLAMTEQAFRRTFGRTSRDIIAGLWGGGEMDEARVLALDRRKESLYREIVAARFPAMPGAAPLVEELHEGGLRLAVGSSGPRENVDLVLRRLGIDTRIRVRITGEDVTRGKPDPQVFSLAAERLGVAPGSALVVEDAPDGIEAAHAAGMRAVALVSTGRNHAMFDACRPEWIVDSLAEVSLPGLRARFG